MQTDNTDKLKGNGMEDKSTNETAEFSHDVFISFSFADQKKAEEIVNSLQSKYGILCWICTRDIDGGRRYKKLIPEAIRASKVVVLLQSESAVESKEIPKEIGIAFDSDKTIIPFKLDTSELHGDLEYDLYGVEYIDATVPTMDERIYELANVIGNVLGKDITSCSNPVIASQSPEKLLPTPPVHPRSIFHGREDIIVQIDSHFKSGENILFLTGIGGIGKTQIVKNYAKQYKSDYDVIIYATYGGSLKNLIISEAPFELSPEIIRLTLSDGSTENDDAFFERKLRKIKKCSNDRTLIILDNFDTEYDSCLDQITDGNYKLLVTTRCDCYSKTYPTIKIGTIASMESLKQIFISNYDGFEDVENDPELENLIKLVNCHTYTVELIAQHMENSGQTVSEMIEALKKQGIMSLNETIRQDNSGTQIAYENLLKMFKIFSLSEEERDILRYLSLMPLEGVAINDFKYWANLTSLKSVKSLETRSWIIRNTDGIALHPIIRDVIRHEIPATEDNCEEFFNRINDTLYNSWHMIMSEKIRYSKICSELLVCFPVITPKTALLYWYTETLFSFSVNPIKAVELANKLFEYYKSTEGELSYNTGRMAFKVGWAYVFNVCLDNAVANAKEWLEKSYGILSKLDLTTKDENAFYGHLLVNLAKAYLLLNYETHNPEDLSCAQKYAELAVALHEKWIFPGEQHYPKVAGSYMQLADVYIASGSFKKAAPLIDEAYRILFGIFGDTDSDTNHALARKAQIAYGMGKYEEALGLTQKTIANYDAFNNELHYERYEQIITKLYCLIKLNRTAEVRETYEYALSIAERLFAEDAKHLSDLKELGKQIS